MNRRDLRRIEEKIRKVEQFVRRHGEPYVSREARRRRNPFRVLIGCMLSLRTKDEVTAEAAARLFSLADTPQAMLEISEEKIARTIYPVGFYRTKARNIRAVCQRLIQDHSGQVPSEMEALLALPGVGRKTANLVLTQGFGLPGICVDTHVHRIANRWGWVTTKTPEQTEMALRDLLPHRYWIRFNGLLVTFGQKRCSPLSPHCSQCPLENDCPRIGVTRHR